MLFKDYLKESYAPDEGSIWEVKWPGTKKKEYVVVRSMDSDNYSFTIQKVDKKTYVPDNRKAENYAEVNYDIFDKIAIKLIQGAERKRSSKRSSYSGDIDSRETGSGKYVGMKGKILRKAQGHKFADSIGGFAGNYKGYN